MKRDCSYGIIPLRVHQKEWQILLVQHQAGHWAFPKGHAEAHETAHEAAERELLEETGLTIQQYLAFDPLIEKYIFTHQKQKISKTVYYFLARVQGDVTIQVLEIKASQWLPLSEAHERLTFKEGKSLCTQVSQLVQSIDKND